MIDVSQDGRAGTESAEVARLLEAYVPGDRRRALASGSELPDRARGAALFADISGFTSLTEALAIELGPQRGAEELTAQLNRVFRALVDELHRVGGEVVYYSGDAITCWVDGDDGLRATTCALAMQEAVSRIGEIVTPGGTHVRVGLKVAVAVGSARRFVVGDPDIQRIDVLAGRVIDALASCEQVAARGDVVLDQSALESLGQRVAIREYRVDGAGLPRCAVVRNVVAPVANRAVVQDGPALSLDTVRRWLLPQVFERLRGGHADFLAELRPAVPMFVHFEGIDYDADDDAIRKLDTVVRSVQHVLATYGGNLLTLTLGDKGGYLYAVFGTPTAHEDDASRAVSAALQLRSLTSTTAASDVRIAIAYGRLLSGTYGHPRRQAFSCLGEAVNVAARLMVSAPSGAVHVTSSLRECTADDFEWDALAPMALKGVSLPVTVFALRGANRRVSRPAAHAEVPLVGRHAELRKLHVQLDGMLSGHGSIVGIRGEAGMGKSRLVAELLKVAESQGIGVAVGECQSYGSSVRYLAWRKVVGSVFGIDETQSIDEQCRALVQALHTIEPGFALRAPLLAAMLGLPMSDNELTAAMDGKLRKTSLESLIADCLRARAAAMPWVVVIEDCHWLDSQSRDLLGVVARTLSDLKVLLVLAYRPPNQASSTLGIESLPYFHEIALPELDDEHAGELIRCNVGYMLGTEAMAPRALVDLVTARAQGNPFYIEELLRFIRSQPVRLQDEAALKTLDLPGSLHSLLLSRIDLLDEGPRRTLKVASVLGRKFRTPMLVGAYDELGSAREVKGHLQALEAGGLLSAQPDADETYLFRHIVTQEVTYQSMPFAFRSALHERIASYIEVTEPASIDRHLDLLAHHYWHSRNQAKKREYLERAGDAAQLSYANPAAIDYFERLAPLVEGGERVDVLLKLGKVQELVGEWHRAEEVDADALRLAEEASDERLMAAAETALAEIARKKGRYQESTDRLERARRRFEQVGDEGGVARVLHLVGTLAAQRGDYSRAVDSYNASFRIRERADDKASMGSLLSNLGIVAEYQGDYAAAAAFHERAIALRRRIGDRWAITNSMNNLGMIALVQERYEEARAWFEKAVALGREVGDAWTVAVCNSNLANVARGLRDYSTARRYYAECLRAYRTFDDRWSVAFLLEDIAVLQAAEGNGDAALELLGAADALRENIGAPRAPALQQEIESKLAAAIAATSEPLQREHRVRGRSLELGAALDRALEACEGGVLTGQARDEARQAAHRAAPGRG